MYSGSRKVALVIGNSAYDGDLKLGPPVADAAAIYSALDKLRWDVTSVLDCNHALLKEAFAKFIAELQEAPADEALFYFSGHGLEVDGENFAVPIDFNPKAPVEAWKLESVQTLINEITPISKVRIVILDACRSDPHIKEEMESKRITKRVVVSEGTEVTKEVTPSFGLAAMNAADNTFIAFAAAPGQVAVAGPDGLSPFTKAIVEHLDAVDLPIWTMTARVRKQVMEATKDETDDSAQQVPWNNESLLRPFFFNPGSLLLFMGTAMALFALILSIAPYSLLLWAQADMSTLLLSATLPLISLGVLLFGMQTAYSRVRGVDAQVHVTELRTADDWRNHFYSSLQKGVLGGYIGSFLCAYVISISYHRHWSALDGTRYCLQRQCDPLEPLGKVMLEITVTTILTASLLGFVTLFLSRSTIGRLAFPVTDKLKMRLFGTTVGGMFTGAVAAPFITLYFGLKSRPELTPDYLLPGCVIGAAFLVFSIVNFDFERLDRNRLQGGAKAAILALVYGAAAAAAIFGPLYLIGVVDAVTTFMTNNPQHWPTLLLGGLAYGLPVGIVLGIVIFAALVYTERFTGKPVAI